MNFLVFKRYSLRLYRKKQHRNSNDEAFSVKKIRKHGKQSVYQPVLILCWCVTMTKRTVHAHVFMYIHMYVSMNFESYVQSKYMHVYTGYKYKILPIFITQSSRLVSFVCSFIESGFVYIRSHSIYIVIVVLYVFKIDTTSFFIAIALIFLVLCCFFVLIYYFVIWIFSACRRLCLCSFV